MEVPFKELILILKQVSVNQIGLDERRVLDYFATGFADQGDEHAEIDPEAPFAKFAKEGFETIIDHSIQRRFAGDATLPRSRYFTVCRHENGDDGGTLVNELKAYLNPRKCGFAAIIDTTSPNEEGERFHRYLVPGSAAIFYVVLDSAVFPSPFGALVGIDRKTNRAQLNGVIPLSITQQTISKVIDLREPETAQWFTHHFTRLTSPVTGLPVFPLAGPLDRFDRLLPTLMGQELGGGIGPTNLAGIWLRRLGVNALIFPSARCNVSVEVLDGKVTDHYGWNLVDYRETLDPQVEIGHDLSPEWVEHPMVGANILRGVSGGDPFIYGGTTIDYELKGRKRGSLAVRELEEQRECMALITTWIHFVDQVRPVMEDDEASRLTSIIFEASIVPGGLLRTKVVSGLSNMFISAAIGDAAAQSEILRLAKKSAEKGDVVTARAFGKFLVAATASESKKRKS